MMKKIADLDIDTDSTKLPWQSEYLQQEKQTEDWINPARKADERLAKLMVEKQARKNIYKTYNSGEKIFLKIGKKRGKLAKRDKVLAGTI